MFQRLGRQIRSVGERLKPREPHRCPHCQAGCGNMGFVWGRIYRSKRGTDQAMIVIQCWECDQFHTYQGQGYQAIQVWTRLLQSRDYRERARMKMEELRMTGKVSYGSGVVSNPLWGKFWLEYPDNFRGAAWTEEAKRWEEEWWSSHGYSKPPPEEEECHNCEGTGKEEYWASPGDLIHTST